jgi:hypothetical protein
MLGRPLCCRANGATRRPCTCLASALRAHHREFPPRAQLPQDRFALDLPSRLSPQAITWCRIQPRFTVQASVPLALVPPVFPVLLQRYLPEWAMQRLPPDVEMRRLAHIFDYTAYETWAQAQGYTLQDARRVDTAYYASRGRLGAGAVVQRGGHLSAAGVHRLLPDGLGKTSHMRAADTMDHPFDSDGRTEIDIAYAAYRIAELGPSGALCRMRAVRQQALQDARHLFAPVEAVLHLKMAPTVRKAAVLMQVLVLAFMAAIMQWPDVDVAGPSWKVAALLAVCRALMGLIA